MEEAEPDRVDAFPRRFKMHGGLDNARQMIRVDRDDQAWTGKAASQFRAHAARLCLPAVDRSKAVVADNAGNRAAGTWPLRWQVMAGRLPVNQCNHRGLERSDGMALNGRGKRRTSGHKCEY